MQVLVVEDTELMRRRVADLLSDVEAVKIVGFTDDVAPTLEALRRTQPDLVLLDIQLKSSKGSDLISYIAERYPRTHVFVFSDLEHPILREVYLKEGAERVFDKATDFFEMRDAVAELSAGKHETSQ